MSEQFPDVLEIVVEIPRGSRNIRLNRVPSSAVFNKLPGNKAVEVSGWCDRAKTLQRLEADRAAFERERAAPAGRDLRHRVRQIGEDGE